MSIVTINLNNKNFQLYCEAAEENELLQLASQLNQRIINLKNSNPSASFELLLVMCALSLEEEAQSHRKKTEKLDKSTNNPEEFSETLTSIAGYLENLAKKMGK